MQTSPRRIILVLQVSAAMKKSIRSYKLFLCIRQGKRDTVNCPW